MRVISFNLFLAVGLVVPIQNNNVAAFTHHPVGENRHLKAIISRISSTSTTTTTTNRINDQQNKYGSTSRLFGQRMRNLPPQKIVSQTEFIQVEEDGSDAWKTMDVVEILQRGGVGVVPTDTGYGFVTPLDSKDGVERVLRIKESHNSKAPWNILFSDLSSIDQYCMVSNKRTFKILKKYLPGPYTFILNSKTTNRGIVFDSKNFKHSWKRQTIGVQIPDDPVLRYLQDDLLEGMPLLIASLPSKDGDDGMDEEEQLLQCKVNPGASWCNDVDFIIEAGERPYDGSTVFDMTFREPELVREGLLGEVELVA